MEYIRSRLTPEYIPFNGNVQFTYILFKLHNIKYYINKFTHIWSEKNSSTRFTSYTIKTVRFITRADERK